VLADISLLLLRGFGSLSISEAIE
jgi:hypothetical protein